MKTSTVLSFTLLVAALPALTQDGPWITYRIDDHLYRIEAAAGATAEDLTVALDALEPRAPDEGVNISPDGGWLLFSTERFGCGGWACLALVDSGVVSGAAVTVTGTGVIHTEGRSAVASGGNLIVYPTFDGPHSQDLFAITDDGTGWSAPQLLTADSPFQFHDFPAISGDGLKVLMDCGDVSGEASLCEVGCDGTGFVTLLSPGDAVAPAGAEGLHHPDYAADGSYLVEIRIDGNDTLWSLAAAGVAPTPVGGLTNDNSPCGLADGRVASLWLERPGNGDGFHELKVMAADGSDQLMLVTGVDVFDVGLGCGGASSLIFADDFEQGNTGAWTATVP
jgi:hypothetical protein